MESSVQRGKFAKAFIGFSIVNVLLRIVLIKFFWDFEHVGLFNYTIFSLCVWLFILALSFYNHQRVAFIIGMAELFVFTVAATIPTGLEGGFYLLMIAAIPVNFTYTSNARRRTTINGVLQVLAIITIVILMRTVLTNSPHDYYESAVFFVINLVGVGLMMGVTGFLFNMADSYEEKERMISHQRILMMANTDPLTSLINRRIMMTRIEQENNRVVRGEKTFSLIMVDVDNFKQINDEFGHDGGDFVLINLAHLINLCLRKSDVVARWGGDEFLILLPETPALNGQVVAEKIKTRISHTPFIYHEIDIPVTVTLGVSECDLYTGVNGTIRKADMALYQGKHGGKDQVVMTE